MLYFVTYLYFLRLTTYIQNNDIMDFIQLTKDKICYEETNTDICHNCKHSKLSKDSLFCTIVPFEAFEVSPTARCMYFVDKPIN